MRGRPARRADGSAAATAAAAAAAGSEELTALAQRPLRLAIFSPAPPIPSGIAAYLVDLLPLLPQSWHIDVFTDIGVIADVATLSRGREQPVACFPHTQFAAHHSNEPYHLIIYQVGNSSERTYMLEYVLRHPGLLVLHDGVLHPSRIDAATAQSDLHPYRRLAADCRADIGAAIGHLVAAGLGGPAVYLTFPMCEDLVRASLVTGMHGELSCSWLRSMVPEARTVPLVHWRSVDRDVELRDRWRCRLGGDDNVIIGSFGNIGAERRLDRVLRALAAIDGATAWRLVVAGRVDPRLELAGLADELGIADRIAWHDALDDAEFVAVMDSVDLAVNLRYPTVRASSGVLHQLLQLGVPVLISDLLHWREYPAAAVARIPPGPDQTEAEALCAALRRWLVDADARAAAGREAAAWAALHITPEAMRLSYLEAIAAALPASPG